MDSEIKQSMCMVQIKYFVFLHKPEPLFNDKSKSVT